MKTRVAVLGCGIVGLLTAKRLMDRGYAVRLYAATPPRLTTSAAAGSIVLPFFPFDPQSPEFRRRMSWTTSSLELYRGYAGGEYFSIVNHIEFCRDGLLEGAFPVEWLPATNLAGVEITDLPQPILGHSQYVRFKLSCVDSVGFVENLFAKLRAGGAEFRQIELDAGGLRHLPERHMFNCLGYWSRALFPDPDLIPVFGQAVRFRPLGVEFGVGLGDFIALSTRYGLYIGSFFVLGRADGTPRPEYYERLQDFAARTLPEIAAATGIAPVRDYFDNPIEVVAGVRPFRSLGVRQEIEEIDGKEIVHNYGHGAHGWTLGWGSAIEAVDLWERLLEKG